MHVWMAIYLGGLPEVTGKADQASSLDELTSA